MNGGIEEVSTSPAIIGYRCSLTFDFLLMAILSTCDYTALQTYFCLQLLHQLCLPLLSILVGPEVYSLCTLLLL